MTAAESLAGWLARRPALDDVEIVGWRFEVVEGEGLRVGVRDSRLGGPYEGPGTALRLGGSIEVHWSDGQQTRAGLDRRAILEPAAELPEWRMAAFRDSSGRLPPVAGPAAIPAVETFDPEIARGIRQEPASMLDTLDRMRMRTLAAGARRVDGVMRASVGRRTVGTSRGFWAAWEETTCTIDLWADEIAQSAFGRRSLPTSDELDGMSDDAVTLARHLRGEQALPSGACGVLFTPAVLDELIGRLLLPHLAARSIRDGRSPFTLAHLETHRQVLRADFDLTIDTTVPMALGSAPCSSDGVPAGRVQLIAGGRLVTPTLDLATAAEFAIAPTPTSRHQPFALLGSSTPPIDFGAALALLGSGVVIRDLPGLHTQQARRSRFALVVPDAQVVSDGVAGGRCAVRIAGNLLDHLTQPTTRLVRMSGELGVGLLVLTGGEIHSA